jgi:hypothetical protein
MTDDDIPSPTCHLGSKASVIATAQGMASAQKVWNEAAIGYVMMRSYPKDSEEHQRAAEMLQKAAFVFVDFLMPKRTYCHACQSFCSVPAHQPKP